MILFFVFDDHTETEWGDVANNRNKASQMWNQFRVMLNKLISDDFIPMIDWRPYLLLTYEVFQYFCQGMNRCQRERLVESWNFYIDGNVEEVNVMSKDIVGQVFNEHQYLIVSTVLLIYY